MGFLQRSLMVRLLTYFLLLAIIPVAAVGYMAYNSGRQSIENQVVNHLNSVATLKEQEIQNWVERLERNMVWLATNLHTTSDTTAMATYIAGDPHYLAAHSSLITEFRRIAILEHMSTVFLLDSTSGQIIASSDASWEGKFRESEPYFIQGKNNTYVSDIFRSLSLGQPTMAVSTPVKDSDGQLLGVLVAHADLEQLSELMMERSGLGETGETYLVNKNNLLLTESRFETGIAFKKWVFTEGVSRALQGKSGTALYLDYREVPVIGAYRWMESLQVVLLAEMDQAEAFATVNNLRNIIAMVAGIILVAAIGVGVLLARQITNPLRKLAEYARRVDKGEYATEVEIKGQDEVASLASDVKTMVGELLQMQERLLTSERLATLGQFSGNISHELRNPLAVIDSSAYYLKKKLKDADKKTQQHLDRIKSSVGSSTTIIDSLLNLTRMKEPQLVKLDLIAIASDAITTSKMSATVKVIKDFPEQEVLVNADGEQFRMAFKNIIKNAVEAMDGKGTLTVTVHTAADGQAEVSFADTGPGIAAEDLDRVFQPLFSTKAKGIGFGLSIAKMVIDKHGGTIKAKSEPGEGATIIIQLPLYIDKEKEA